MVNMLQKHKDWLKAHGSTVTWKDNKAAKPDDGTSGWIERRIAGYNGTLSSPKSTPEMETNALNQLLILGKELEKRIAAEVAAALEAEKLPELPELPVEA